MGRWNRIAKYVKWLSAYWVEMHGLDTLLFASILAKIDWSMEEHLFFFKEVYIDCLTVFLRYLLASLKLD